MFQDFNSPEEEDLEFITKLNRFEIITENIDSQNSYAQNFCHFHRGGKVYLIWATKDYFLEIYDLQVKFLILRIKVHDTQINSCHYFHDAKSNRDLIITTSDDKFIKIWNFQDFSLILKIENDTVASFRNAFIFAEISKNLKDEKLGIIRYYIISELSDYVVALYDFNGKFIKKVKDITFFDLWHCPKVNSCQLVGSYAGSVKLYNLKSGELTKEFKCHGVLVEAALLNDVLITGDEEGYLRTYNIEENSLMDEVKLDSKIIHITIWDIEYFFAFLENGYIHCYEAKTLTNVKIMNPICEKVTYAESILYQNFGPGLIITGPKDFEKSMLGIITSEPHIS